MRKNLIGMVAFGNLPFTKLAVKGIRDTVTKQHDIYIVIGKPNDVDTLDWVRKEGILHTVHNSNYGFPYSLNDIYDFAWKINNYDTLTIIGNDVVAYPYAIDSLIEVAETTNYEWISATQYDVKALVRDNPNCAKYFSGENYNIVDFSDEIWNKVPVNYSSKINIIDPGLSDIHNLALYKRSVFDKIGYIDVNFYPAYYSDNDYCRRGVNIGSTVSCTVTNAVYFHFWSRTIYQESGGSNHAYFRNNRDFYMTKWGGDFSCESFKIPFNGRKFRLCEDVFLPSSLKIDSRYDEPKIIEFWKSRI